jgi:hypothetical protein
MTALPLSLRQSRMSLLAVVLISFTACDTVDDSSNMSVRRDSAGVTIVENTGPSWRAGEEWTVDSVPLFAIAPDAGQHAEFQGIMNVIRLDDGTVVANDRRGPSVRAFAPDGSVRWTSVREGDGPGELRSAGFIHRLAGDSISVEANLAPKALLLDSDGNYVEELPIIPVGSSAPDVLGRYSQVMLRMADGAAVGIISELTRAHVEGTAVPTPIMEFHVVHRDGSSSLLGNWPMMTLGTLLTPIAAWAPLPDGFLYGWPTQDEFRVYGASGELRMIVRGPGVPRAPNADEIASAREWYAEGQENAVQARRDAAERPVADSISLYRRLVSSRTGEIWRERYDAGTDGRFTFKPEGVMWDVFTADGSLLGGVLLPTRFTLTDAGEDWLAGIHIDEMDVQTPRVYRLVRR